MKKMDTDCSIEDKNNRIVYLDYLRVAATFAVIILHVAAQNWYVTDVNSFEWKIFNIYNSVVRWAVPVFVMISGTVFLNREHSVKNIFCKNILRLVTAFIFWSAIYATFSNVGKQTPMLNFLSGHFHMWFIPMIIGLYICIPIIKKITESEKVTKYFL